MVCGLAAKLGINSVGLAETITRFNANAGKLIDPDFHRGENWNDIVTTGDRKKGLDARACLAPLETPPFYGAALWPGTMATNGGLSTNGNAQVVNVWGEVIPRLYATGNCMASVMGAGYAGGGSTLGPGMTFAWIAGKHVSVVKPWD